MKFKEISDIKLNAKYKVFPGVCELCSYGLTCDDCEYHDCPDSCLCDTCVFCELRRLYDCTWFSVHTFLTMEY